MVLDYMETPDDIPNCAKASPYFEDLLTERLQQANNFSLVLDILRKQGALKDSRRNVKHLRKLRLVCKSWRLAVDIHFQARGWSYWVQSKCFYDKSYLILQYYNDFAFYGDLIKKVVGRSQAIHGILPVNPFPMHSLHPENDNLHPWRPPMEILSNFGDRLKVLYLTAGRFRDVTIPIYHRLLKVLPLTPAITTLHLHLPITFVPEGLPNVEFPHPLHLRSLLANTQSTSIPILPEQPPTSRTSPGRSGWSPVRPSHNPLDHPSKSDQVGAKL